jgi:hypothetical protein
MIADVFWTVVLLIIAGVFLCRRWAAGQERIYDRWRAAQGLPPLDTAFPKTTWKTHFARAWQNEVWSRVFHEELGNWPTILKREAKPNTYRIEARYPSPRTMKDAKFWALIAAAVFGYWVSKKAEIPVNPWEDWWQANTGAVLVSVALGAISYPIFRAVFRRTLWRWSRPMKMTIEGARIEWSGDEQAKQWWRFSPKAVVLPAETRRLRVIPHRKATEELRINQERREQRKKPLPMHYQQCSELMIVSGPSLAKWQQVAEIAKDEHGERAGLLAQAIDYACAAAQGTLGRTNQLELQNVDIEE